MAAGQLLFLYQRRRPAGTLSGRLEIIYSGYDLLDVDG